jgi:catalase (peroxidase I)
MCETWKLASWSPMSSAKAWLAGADQESISARLRAPRSDLIHGSLIKSQRLRALRDILRPSGANAKSLRNDKFRAGNCA